MANGTNPRSFIVRDAAKLVALVIAIGSCIGGYHVLVTDIEGANKRGLANAQHLEVLSSAFQEHRLQNATDSAAIRENTRRVKGHR